MHPPPPIRSPSPRTRSEPFWPTVDSTRLDLPPPPQDGRKWARKGPRMPPNRSPASQDDWEQMQDPPHTPLPLCPTQLMTIAIQDE